MKGLMRYCINWGDSGCNNKVSQFARWSEAGGDKEIVLHGDVISDNYFYGSTTIKIEVFSGSVLNCPGQGGLDGNRSTSEEIDGIEKQREDIVDCSF